MAQNLRDRFLDWLFDRSASCAALRGEVSLYERQVVCLQDDLQDMQAGGRFYDAAYASLKREVAMLHGVIRELRMEGMRKGAGDLIGGLRQDAGATEISRGDLSVPAPTNTAVSQAERPPGKYLPETLPVSGGTRGNDLNGGTPP